MKPLQVAEGIVPIAQFKSHAAQWLKRVHDSEQPVIITVNGKAAGVLISPVEFDKMQERQRLITNVAEGLADFEADRIVTHAVVRKRLSKNHR